ncbi:MAG: hypothetical protein ABIH42_02970, partial [Planctomycetota bacterium]
MWNLYIIRRNMKESVSLFVFLSVLILLCSCGTGGEKAEPRGEITVTTGGCNPATGTVEGVLTNIPMLQFTFTAFYNHFNVTSVSVTAYGTGDDCNTVSSVNLWHDVNMNGIAEDSVDVLLVSGQIYSEDDGVLVFTFPESTIIQKSTRQTWLVTYDFNISADGTYTCSIVNTEKDITTDVNGCNKKPVGERAILGGTKSLSAGSLTVFTGSNPPADRAVNTASEQEHIAMLQFALQAGAYADVDVLGITFTASGSGNDYSGISGIQLWLDANNDGLWNVDDVEIDGRQTFSADNGIASFSGSPLITLSAGEAPENWLVTYNLNANVDGTFSCSILNISTDVSAQASGTTVQVIPKGFPVSLVMLRGLTLTTDGTPPTITRATYEDVTGNEIVDYGDMITVEFNERVVITCIDPQDCFQLLNSGDSFGDDAVCSEDIAGNSIVITLGDSPVLNPTGVFDSENPDAGPSGIDISPALAEGIIEDIVGNSAVPRSPNQGVDIWGKFVPSRNPQESLHVNVMRPLGEQSGNVIVQYFIADADGNGDVHLSVEYSADSGLTFTEAANATPEEWNAPFNPSGTGDLRIFVWDSYVDIPTAGTTNSSDPVMLRFTFTNSAVTPQTVIDQITIQLDNKPQARTSCRQFVNLGQEVRISAVESFAPSGEALS